MYEDNDNKTCKYKVIIVIIVLVAFILFITPRLPRIVRAFTSSAKHQKQAGQMIDTLSTRPLPPSD